MTREYLHRSSSNFILTLVRPEIMGQAHPVTNKMEAHNVWMVCDLNLLLQ